MKHKKTFLIITILTIIFICSIIIVKKNKEVYHQSKNYEINDGNLSIMLEETPKKGDYMISNLNMWPDDNYVYNSNLSYCENGSKLNWNDETRMLTFSSSFTDKCYLYFDIYIKPTVNSLNITSTDTSININPSITEGDYPVSKIIYKLDNEEEIESIDNNHTFNNVSSITKHTIDVYAKDTNGKTSKTYTYTLPTIISLSSKSELTTIQMNLKTETGTEDITTYYYSKDNGATYIETNTDSYTFTNLAEGTIYNLRAYIKDKNGIKSMHVIKAETTKKRPTTPKMKFDNNYNIVLSDSTSNNGTITYYYSIDNKTFTKGNTINLSNSATIYAYAMDSSGYKSDTVSKNVTINNASNGTVSTTYYCNKTNSYQTSSTCNYSYEASKNTNYECSAGSYNYSKGYCSGTYGSGRSWTWRECEQTCSSDVHGGYSYTCEYNSSTDGYYCSFNYGSPTISTTYSCPNGGTLSGATCTGVTYTGTLKYKCNSNSTYHDNQASATSACKNYCATGTYYNGKCYKLG